MPQKQLFNIRDTLQLNDLNKMIRELYSQIASILPMGVTNGNAHDHVGGDGAQIAYGSLSGNPTLGTAASQNISAFAPAAAGIPSGGTNNQALLKDGATNYVTKWGNVWLKADLNVESGTWTPTLYGTTTAGSPTYTTQSGRYICIGDFVRVEFQIIISSKGGMDGSLRVGNLPFAATGNYNTIRQFIYGTGITVTNMVSLAALVTNTAPVSINIRAMLAASSTISDTPVATSNVANATAIYGVVTYYV